MTRIIGSLVIKNELDRYLIECIRHSQAFLDEIFVYDDISTDGSAQACANLGCRTVVRPASDPSFMEHEGYFRYNAWLALEKIIQPQIDDWIFSFDADEFLVSEKDTRDTLEKAIYKAKHNTSIVIPRPEIFKVENGKTYSRIDGFWNNIRCTRLFKYRPNGDWNLVPMGCGSEPTYVAKGPRSNHSLSLELLHYGYARKQDLEEKYMRYNNLEKHGHNDSHIQSIIKPPKLIERNGPVPEILKGYFSE